ncbi:protein of unknown function DUF1329 [Burkholderia sp. H160]|nr:protein of unknown function DUF1329 [Burkholderia sp. H160]
MRFGVSMMAAALAFAFAVPGSAAPTPEEVAQLGKTLTPVGAIKAGNADGTIPPWDGGICTPPAGYKPRNGVGGFPYVDPYASEKPLFSITGQNMDKYADKLDEGVKVLLKRYPNYRMDVYPTHRSACMPDWVYENTIKNVMNPRTTSGGLGLEGAHAQVPFPIPKDGYEAMWNANMKYTYPWIEGDASFLLVDAAGNRTLLNVQNVLQHLPYWDEKKEPLKSDQYYWILKSTNTQPAAEVGTASLMQIYMRPDVKDNMAWSYIPGQRRVRLAPEFKYDTVSPNSGGMLLYDEINGFYGKMDKYDFKLIGRKEMYVQYNSYRTEMATQEQIGTKNFANPDYTRWELHRVWVVQADLKPGQRHVEKRKVFYIDEDSWYIFAYYGLDEAGKVYHYMQLPFWQEYEKPSPWNGNYLLYDFNKGIWSNQSQQGNPEFKQTGFYKVKPFGPGEFAPESMAGSGLR